MALHASNRVSKIVSPVLGCNVFGDDVVASCFECPFCLFLYHEILATSCFREVELRLVNISESLLILPSQVFASPKIS